MDEKKKFEIEFDDDFDAWFAQHEQATKDLKPPARPADNATAQQDSAKPAFPAINATEDQGQKALSVPVFPAIDKPAQPASAVPAFPATAAPSQPAADIPVQQKPAAPSQPAADIPVQQKPAAPAQPVFNMPEQPVFDIPVQQRPAAPSQPAADIPVQQKPAAPAQPAADIPVQRKGGSQQFRPVDSNDDADIPINRSDVVKNFKLHIDEEEYDKPAAEESEQVVKRDKSVYFAGRKPSKAQIEHRNAQEKAREEKAEREKKAMTAQRVKERKKVNRLRRFLVLILVVVCSAVLSTYAISCINDVLALNRSNELITISVEKGEGYEEIMDTLDDSGLIKHKWFCKLICKFRGFDEKEYLNGMHYLTPDMGVEGMLTQMLVNQTSDKTIRVSFPEGWTLPQIINRLDENNICPAEYIYDALEGVEFEYGFVSAIPDDGARCYALEGYIFPDTYDFFVSDKPNGIGENPTSIINKFLGNFEAKWSDVYTKRANELGLTMDEVLIIASIIQKEAANKSQMGKVSSVIHNRLNSSSYPALECDSTKNYVTSYLAPVLGTAGAGAYIGGYDTYARSGLPAGPICNPGADAIEAALYPDDTDYYYFCHNEAGEIYMAETYSEFQANWAQVLRDNEAN